MAQKSYSFGCRESIAKTLYRTKKPKMSKPSIQIDCERYHPQTLRLWAAMQAAYVEDVEGSYFKVVGFVPEKPGDVIPQQSAFITGVRFFLASATTAVGSAASVSIIERLFVFLLKPAYAPFHRHYKGWRQTMNAKCVEYCADDRATKKLRTLCRRYRTLFPEPVDEDPS
jgi:hypothetical protein